MNYEPLIQSACTDRRTNEMLRYLINNAFLRVVNYHNTDVQNAARFEQEIAQFARHFSPVTIKDLDGYFETGIWPKEKPGLIPAIFEGYRNHVDVMLPILEKYNFTGWFYIPSFFMDVPPGDQLAFTETHDLRVSRPECYPDGRYAMNWDEVRRVAKHNEICCHTGSHFEITKTTSDEDMHREIVTAKRKLEEQIDRRVDVFCWLYGEEYRYNQRAHPHLAEAGYRYVVSNLKIERIV
jgi:peptidoglycan/xylan/chitin deacetylase (PgdA/CDA1 family)